MTAKLVQQIRDYVDSHIVNAIGIERSLLEDIDHILTCAPAAETAPEAAEQNVTGAEPCCRDYANCNRACIPRRNYLQMIEPDSPAKSAEGAPVCSECKGTSWADYYKGVKVIGHICTNIDCNNLVLQTVQTHVNAGDGNDATLQAGYKSAPSAPHAGLADSLLKWAHQRDVVERDSGAGISRGTVWLREAAALIERQHRCSEQDVERIAHSFCYAPDAGYVEKNPYARPRNVRDAINEALALERGGK